MSISATHGLVSSLTLILSLSSLFHRPPPILFFGAQSAACCRLSLESMPRHSKTSMPMLFILFSFSSFLLLLLVFTIFHFYLDLILLPLYNFLILSNYNNTLLSHNQDVYFKIIFCRNFWTFFSFVFSFYFFDFFIFIFMSRVKRDKGRFPGLITSHIVGRRAYFLYMHDTSTSISAAPSDLIQFYFFYFILFFLASIPVVFLLPFFATFLPSRYIYVWTTSMSSNTNIYICT